jgi:hypothetical protein
VVLFWNIVTSSCARNPKEYRIAIHVVLFKVAFSPPHYRILRNSAFSGLVPVLHLGLWCNDTLSHTI